MSREEYWKFAERLLVSLAALLAIGQALGTVLHFFQQQRTWIPAADFFADLIKGSTAIQFFVIAILVAAKTRLPAMHETQTFNRAIKASRQFNRFWFFVWVSWLGMYGIWFLQSLQFFTNIDPRFIYLATDFFGLLASSQLFLCYLVMVKSTVPPEHGDWYREISLVLLGITAIIVVQALCIFTSKSAVRIDQLFEGLEGLLSGVGLALFVGRLESKLIASPRSIVAALYAYAVLQFSYPQLMQDKSTFLALTTIALFLKLTLFVEVRRLISSGILTYYMHEYERRFDKDQKHRSVILAQLLKSHDSMHDVKVE
ncbi:MAG TPA: hypothetical protein VGG48_01445 [Rhizomicrobium sp.]|jgi:hypothetical protein